jgi:hypothetical protein
LASTDYPENLLAREPAPPYEGEGPFALWRFSEDPSLGRFQPHTPATNPGAQPLVWAVDTRHAPMFWFPRDCPRGCIWPVSATTAADRERFFGQSATDWVHVIEADWLGPCGPAACMPTSCPPRCSGRMRWAVIGSLTSRWTRSNGWSSTIFGQARPRPDRASGHAVDLAVWRRVVGSTVEFSGSRLRNTAPHPDWCG